MSVKPASPDLAATIDARLAERAPWPDVDWMVVCGSGLGMGLVEEPELGLKTEVVVPLEELGLPAPAVEGHGHSLVFGRVGARRVCMQAGRLHPYEGHPVATCVGALSAMLRRGVGGVVLTCAVGALAPELEVGQLVLLADQMNLLGPTPLVGPKFLDCSRLYTPALRARIQAWASASQRGPLHEVVYAHARGPQYETPAETRALRALGGDVVGMSTTYEALCVAELGAMLAGIGVVTNAAGAEDLSHEEVQVHSARARASLARLLAHLLGGTPGAP